MHVHNYDSSFCFWVFEKRLTQKNSFLFSKNDGLFNSCFFFGNNQEIYTILLPNFHGQRSGGIFHTRSRVVSAMERVRSKNLYTVSLEISCEISG